MTKTDSFETQVNKGLIASPTTRGFDASTWTDAYRAARTSAEDDRLHEAGLWFGATLGACWQRIADLGLDAFAIEPATRHLAMMANLMHLQTEAQLHRAAMTVDRRALPSGSLANHKLGDGGADDATADMTRTSTIDTIGKAISTLRNGPRSGGRRFVQAEMADINPILSDIYLLEFLWPRVQRLGWRLDTSGDEARFTLPEADPAGRSMAIMEWRRDQLLIEFQHVFGLEWRAANSTLPAVPVVKARRRGDAIRFEVEHHLPGGTTLTNTYVMLRLVDAGELQPYLDKPLSRLDHGLTLRDLLSAWELLALAATSITELLFNEKPKSYPRLAPAIAMETWTGLLAHLGWPAAKCRAAIDFLTFERVSRDGLWTRPLLPVGGDKLIPVLTPLICAGIDRIAELWVADGAGETFFAQRGGEFETKLRLELAEGLATRRWAADAMVYQTPWKPKINKVASDIDLLIRIGRVVYVGELKLKRYPNAGAEFARHLDEFAHAAGQLDIRCPYLAANKPDLARRLGYAGPPDDLIIRGFILTGTDFGSGMMVGGYPVIDQGCLTYFFKYDQFMISAKFDRALGYEGRPTEDALAIRMVDDDPATALLAYLRHPLHVRHPELALTRHERPNDLHIRGGRMIWQETAVDAPRLGSAHAHALMAQLKQARAGWIDEARRDLSTGGR